MTIEKIPLAQISGYFKGTKAAIVAVTGVVEGSLAYATDTKEFGTYNGTVWDWSTSGSLPNPFALTADITPTTLTGNVNNYNPTSLSTSDVLRLATDGGNYNITGIAGGADGRILVLQNIGSGTIILVNASASSDADKRFDITSNVNIRLNRTAIIQYDSTASRWKLLSSGDADSLRGSAISAGLLASLLDGDFLYWNAGDASWQRIASADVIIADEHIQDVVGAMFTGNTETGINATYEDSDGTIDLAVSAPNGIVYGSFTITGASGVFQDTGISLTLPSAGTYAIDGSIRAYIQGDAGCYVIAKLYNSTDGADVADTEVLCIYEVSTNIGQNSVSMVALVTVAASKVIKLYASRTGTGFVLSGISNDVAGRTRLRYTKIG